MLSHLGMWEGKGMVIQWQPVATIAAPIIALFVGLYLNRAFERRPKLIAYYQHVSSFRWTPPDATPGTINTHAIVLTNSGREPATNVRLHHRRLPDYNIWPAVPHHVEELPDGSKDIVIPTLIRDKTLTISYLYGAPLIAAEINNGIECDQGMAKAIPVLLMRVYPRWVYVGAWGLMVCGLVAILYVAYVAI
jgi:hypothetical protein